jgi:uncharacterized membrane protein
MDPLAMFKMLTAPMTDHEMADLAIVGLSILGIACSSLTLWRRFVKRRRQANAKTPPAPS